MIRADLNWGSQFAAMLMLPDPGPVVRERVTTDGPVIQQYGKLGATFPYWVRLKKEGNNYTGYNPPDGINWNKIRTTQVDMGNDVFIGLAGNSHTPESTATFTFTDALVTEAKGDYDISAISNLGGKVTPSGNMMVAGGTNLEFSIVPNSGYVVSDVTVNDESKGAITTLKLDDISQDYSIKVKFVLEGTPVSGTEVHDIKVHPNPASGLLNIQLDGHYHAVVKLFTIDGKECYTGVINAGQKTINVNAFEHGIYILTLKGADFEYRTRIVVE